MSVGATNVSKNRHVRRAMLPRNKRSEAASRGRRGTIGALSHADSAGARSHSTSTTEAMGSVAGARSAIAEAAPATTTTEIPIVTYAPTKPDRVWRCASLMVRHCSILRRVTSRRSRVRAIASSDSAASYGRHESENSSRASCCTKPRAISRR